MCHYLQVMQCDNKALVNMFHSSRMQLIERRARQLALITKYTNDVLFIGAKENQAAEALSRIFAD